VDITQCTRLGLELVDPHCQTEGHM
jgi:hypothetical protein